ncbi:MAG TPA: type II toxin-antitoxin system ParD family antitoxin [Polyangiaceae bacterium]|nr:type II toxin-antitoxin system ParD family antitoxin [Polyangiaceae bacterium]
MSRTTTITLGEELNAFVEGLISRGRYATTSEVVRAALRKLEAEEASVARWIAYAESLPVEEPSPSERTALDELDAARGRGELDAGMTVEQYRRRGSRG